MNLKNQRMNNTLFTSANWGKNSVLPSSWNKQSKLPSIERGQTNTNPADFYNDIQFLDWKLNSVRKNITNYDIYKIMGTVVDPNTFNSMKTQLINNSALVINTSLLTGYHKGDIVYKDNFGEIQRIEAPMVGLYYPSYLNYNPTVTGNVVTLTYAFNPNEPALDEAAVVDVSQDGEVPLNPQGQAPGRITFTGINLEASDKSAYGYLYEVSSLEKDGAIYKLEIPAAKTTGANESMRPDIRCYSDNLEEVSVDDLFKITPLDGNKQETSNWKAAEYFLMTFDLQEDTCGYWKYLLVK